MENQKIEFITDMSTYETSIGNCMLIDGRSVDNYSVDEMSEIFENEKLDNEYFVMTAASLVLKRIKFDSDALSEYFSPEEEKEFEANNIVEVIEKVYKRLKKLSKN